MKKFGIVLLVVFIAQWLSADERNMLNLNIPSGLESGQMRFSFQHRFYGTIDDKPFETLFGMHNGGNVGLDLQVAIAKHFQIIGSYIFNHKESNLGIGYRFPGENAFLHTQVSIHYFSFKPTIDDRKSNFFGQILIQTDPLFKLLIPTFNVVYDNYYRKIGVGIGIDLAISKKLSVLGEYYPVFSAAGMNEYNGVALGIKLNTYGHRFIFIIGNTYEIGTRQLFRGAESNDLYFGFTIHRLLEL